MRTFLRLLAFLAPFWWWVGLSIVLGCVMVASNITLLSMAAYLIAAAALEPLLITLTLPMYIVRFMSVSRSCSRYAERLVSHDVTFRLLAQLRSNVYAHLEPLLPARLLTYRSGDVLARLVSDIDELQNIYLRLLAPFVVAIVVVVLTWGVFAVFSPLLAWVALAFLLIAGVGVPLLAGMLSRGLGQQQLATRAELNAQVVDSIQGMQDLLACGSEGEQQRKISALDQTLGHIQRRMARISGTQQAAHDLVMNLALWTLLLLALPLVAARTINAVYLGALALLVLASFEIVPPLAQAFQFLGHSLAAGERIFGVIDAVPAVVDPAQPLPAPTKNVSAEYMLEFERASFAYDATEGEVLHAISLPVRLQSRIAIVGPSGAGKSTLVQLALRFWDPTAGTICLYGQDIRQYALHDLRAAISVVAQDTYLFNDTLRANLLLARPTATDRELEQVLMQAGLAEFVSLLPDGLRTWIGEQGLRLSGGERQRLAIARALLKDAPLLILDEATANLDPLTERALLATLSTLMQGRTTLMITHRLVALEQMDEIFVLDDGRVSQHGTHEQLLREGGLYRQLFAIQNEVLVLA